MTRRKAPWLLVLLGLQGLLLYCFFVPCVVGPDANAYQVSARMMAATNRLSMPQPPDFAFLGPMTVIDRHGLAYPKYAPVYPTLAGVLMKGFGDLGGLLLSPTCVLLTVCGAWFLFRSALSAGWALLGCAMLASTPALNVFGLHQLSHTCDMAFLAWGFAWFAIGSTRSGASRAVYQLASGVAVGCAAGVRYTDLLLALPIVTWFALRWRTSGRSAMVWLAALAAPCAAVALYHTIAFGHPLRTGYALTGEQRAFRWSHIAENFATYTAASFTHGVGPIAALSLLGFVSRWRRAWRDAAFFAAWCGPSLLLHLSYYWLPADNPINLMRFLLPLSLPCMLLALSCARDAWARWHGRPMGRALIAGVMVLQVGWGLSVSIREMSATRASFADQSRRNDFVREHLPRRAVLITDAASALSLDYYRDYLLYGEELFFQPRLARALINLRRAEFPFMQRERPAMVQDQLINVDPATYRKRIRALLDGLLATERGVFLFVSRETATEFERAWGVGYELRTIAAHDDSGSVLAQLGPRDR